MVVISKYLGIRRSIFVLLCDFGIQKKYRIYYLPTWSINLDDNETYICSFDKYYNEPGTVRYKNESLLLKTFNSVRNI